MMLIACGLMAPFVALTVVWLQILNKTSDAGSQYTLVFSASDANISIRSKKFQSTVFRFTLFLYFLTHLFKRSEILQYSVKGASLVAISI